MWTMPRAVSIINKDTCFDEIFGQLTFLRVTESMFFLKEVTYCDVTISIFFEYESN
jgi:hypothetical protein